MIRVIKWLKPCNNNNDNDNDNDNNNYYYYYNNIGFARSKRSHVVHFIQSQSEFSQLSLR